MAAARSVPDQPGVLARSRDGYECHRIEFQQAAHQQVPPVLSPEWGEGWTGPTAAPAPAA
jgi:hypothetical protein